MSESRLRNHSFGLWKQVSLVKGWRKSFWQERKTFLDELREAAYEVAWQGVNDRDLEQRVRKDLSRLRAADAKMDDQEMPAVEPQKRPQQHTITWETSLEDLDLAEALEKDAIR